MYDDITRLMDKLGRNQLMIIALLIASLGYVTHESAYAATFNLTWANHIQMMTMVVVIPQL